MCGIAGFISKDYGKEELVKMTNSLKHRGPDAFGYFFNAKQGIGLGHIRLRIVDLYTNDNFVV
jgi:asparagine synthase (glutamine-hydrolysing)